MFNPESLKLNVWSDVVTVFYVVSYILDPLIIVYEFKFLTSTFVQFLVTASTIIFTIDIIVTIFTASINEDDPMLDDYEVEEELESELFTSKDAAHSLRGR